jgi:Cdc25 family phosphatase
MRLLALSLSNLFLIFIIVGLGCSFCRAFAVISKHAIRRHQLLKRGQSARGMSGDYPRVTYIEASELASIIRDQRDSVDRTFAVVDVRDDDYYGGHIPGAVNVPSLTWDDDDTVEKLIKDYVEPGKEKEFVVFHCMQSMQRGPSCAMRFANRLSFEKADNPNIRTEV